MIALLIAAAALAAPPVVNDDAFRQTVMRAHDRERQEVGSPPLRWDEGLARDAATWARHLADTDTFDHCSEVGCPTEEQGENLWMGTKGAFGLERMLQGWSSEKRQLAGLSSWEDDSSAVGHYTQMVWSRTSRVGCAVASNRSDEYLVCRYMAAGNVMGESPFASGRRGGGQRAVADAGVDGPEYADELQDEGQGDEGQAFEDAAPDDGTTIDDGYDDERPQQDDGFEEGYEPEAVS